MPRENMPARILLLAAFAVACAAIPSDAAQTKNVDRTLHLDATGAVTLDSHNGTIQVHTWDRPDIEIHARIEAAGSSEEDLRRFHDTNVEIDGTSGTVHIKSKMPDYNSSGFSWWFLNGNNPEIHYTITAPRNAHWTIRDHNSRTDIHDVNGALDVDTHNGSLRVANLGGRLELRMHNGDAHVDFAAFTHDSLVDMHNGSVELSMPASSKFNLRSEGHNNSVHSDFAVVSHMSGNRDRHSQMMDGAVNGGGPSLRLSAHNGSFRIRAR